MGTLLIVIVFSLATLVILGALTDGAAYRPRPSAEISSYCLPNRSEMLSAQRTPAQLQAQRTAQPISRSAAPPIQIAVGVQIVENKKKGKKKQGKKNQVKQIPAVQPLTVHDVQWVVAEPINIYKEKA